MNFLPPFLDWVPFPWNWFVLLTGAESILTPRPPPAPPIRGSMGLSSRFHLQKTFCFPFSLLRSLACGLKEKRKTPSRR